MIIMYDKKKQQTNNGLISKSTVIMDRPYYGYDKSNGIMNTKTSGVPTENLFF